MDGQAREGERAGSERVNSAAPKINNRRMTRDSAHRPFEKLFSRRNLVPWRSAGRMRQWNQIKPVIRAARPEFSADHLLELLALDELRDGEPSDRNYQTRLENLDLLVHPRCTISDFVRRRHAIGSARRFSGETSAYRRKIDSRTNGGLVYSTELLEPAKQCLAGGVRERTFQSRFTRPRRLSNNHNVADNRATGHRL